jgi:outer membrane receptor protein involved in Fe transport
VLEAQASYGNRNTTSDEVAADVVRGPFRARIEGDFFNTGGWDIVAPAFRGPIDHNSSSIHEVFGGLLEYKQSQNVSVFLRGSYYHEVLDLGTALRSASATRGLIDGGGTLSTDAGDHFQLSTYAHQSSYDESFAMANSTRTAETRSQLQTVPSRDVGGFLTWTRDFFAGRRGLANQMSAGGDFRLIDGSSRDQFFDPTGSFVVNRDKSSGRQNFFGVFAEDLYHPLDNLQIVPSVRFDFFQNLDGRIANRPRIGAPTVTTFPDRMRTATSPRLGVRYSPQQWLGIRAALYEAFRAPTLAELYRQSTVEDLILIPNPRLRPEFLEGGEVGFDLTVAGLALGVTGYWNILHAPISNVVTAVNPITGRDAARTRENLGRARIRGYEIQSSYDVEWLDRLLHLPRDSSLRLTANFLNSEATLVSNPPDPTLVGRRLALVSWQNLELGMRYSNPRIGEVLLEEQYHSKQWEDSDNHDLQPSYWLTNLTFSHPVPPLSFVPSLQGSMIFLKFQNLLNHTYIVDLGGGIPKIGTPFTVLGGLSAPLKF